jgi:long-chain acyl-CoA synthetase
MPMFHGFGLGVCVHTALTRGVTALLVPRFTVESYARLLQRRRPNYVAGVPTLFEALLRLPNTARLDFSSLIGVYSGGDSLSPDLKRRVNAFLRERGAQTDVREGYGLTECVTASCLTPEDGAPDGSIGLPFPDTSYKIVAPGTRATLPHGETGEICISGPSVMPGYDGDPEETAQALQTHGDGAVWLHTGDLGAMDADGYVYFRGRIKRVIVTSGYNVYPFQIESVLNRHPAVRQACVVGVPDDYRMHRVKAYLVLNDTTDNAVLESVRAYCKEHLAPHERPREYELRTDLPRTKLGKIAYTELEGK